ncbi:hypothetical protein Moror_2490 [Moniliophthora roreri MCA 2997]|uniref:Uncharacterized protein n=1 Tax=Moniliophthora roreri (strain MCA 2997) TaxID=1381753 RepID=V2WYX8_MONRO|nr:hypothetical protein Moror_2490 [Moniliophthora roreri MCA 2997]
MQHCMHHQISSTTALSYAPFSGSAERSSLSFSLLVGLLFSAQPTVRVQYPLSFFRVFIIRPQSPPAQIIASQKPTTLLRD